MTIPTLIKNYQEKQLKTQFEKTYATLNQALLFSVGKYDYRPRCYYDYVPGYAGNGPTEDCINLGEKFFLESLKVAKYCPYNALKNGCIPEYEGFDTIYQAEKPEEEGYGAAMSIGCENFRKLSIHNNRAAYVLSDGTIVIPYSGNSPVLIAVDINGMSGPNKWGYDLFSFLIGVENGNTFRYYGGGCMRPEKGGQGTQDVIDKMFE